MKISKAVMYIAATNAATTATVTEVDGSVNAVTTTNLLRRKAMPSSFTWYENFERYQGKCIDVHQRLYHWCKKDGNISFDRCHEEALDNSDKVLGFLRRDSDGDGNGPCWLVPLVNAYEDNNACPEGFYPIGKKNNNNPGFGDINDGDGTNDFKCYAKRRPTPSPSNVPSSSPSSSVPSTSTSPSTSPSVSPSSIPSMVPTSTSAVDAYFQGGKYNQDFKDGEGVLIDGLNDVSTVYTIRMEVYKLNFPESSSEDDYRLLNFNPDDSENDIGLYLSRSIYSLGDFDQNYYYQNYFRGERYMRQGLQEFDIPFTTNDSGETEEKITGLVIARNEEGDVKVYMCEDDDPDVRDDVVCEIDMEWKDTWNDLVVKDGKILFFKDNSRGHRSGEEAGGSVQSIEIWSKDFHPSDLPTWKI